jgi:predicted transglutaminase-like cysteine proteinase
MKFSFSKVSIFTLLIFSTVVVMASFTDLSAKVYSAIEKKYGKRARVRVYNWQKLMSSMSEDSSLSDKAKVREANDFFNKVRWVSDIKHWGKEDYWATPFETLGTNAGDCEDFSIGKYFTLNEAGVNSEKIRITYVKALDYNQAHMVLAYYSSPEAEPLILDNINKTILPASQRQDLLPIYSFNAESLWLAKARSKKLKASSQKNLPQWRKVNERMLEELMK